MDFTREPIIESIVTPREGFKLVVRSSKGSAQDEYFVDSVEVVAFGNTLFFRSRERPKCFLVPVADYEVLEVREARMVLKNIGTDRTIKIAGGRAPKEKNDSSKKGTNEASSTKTSSEPKPERKRERRRPSRRRRGREDRELVGAETEAEKKEDAASVKMPPPPPHERVELPHPSSEKDPKAKDESQKVVKAILPPPDQLISQTIDRYRDDENFKGVFVEAAPVVEASTDDIKAELRRGQRQEKRSQEASKKAVAEKEVAADKPILEDAPSKPPVSPPPPPPIEESMKPSKEPSSPEAESQPAGEEVH